MSKPTNTEVLKEIFIIYAGPIVMISLIIFMILGGLLFGPIFLTIYCILAFILITLVGLVEIFQKTKQQLIDKGK